MLELLSPAGSPEAVIAAVQNGADAVYMGLGSFNARRGAQNFSNEEFEKSVKYCHIRGCKVYATLNTIVNDREYAEALGCAEFLASIGVDAILVQDIGLASAIRTILPDVNLHASTQMSIHNLAGVEAAAQMGFKRAVLARELSYDKIKFISQNSTIETEVFIHGALCFSYSGQCYMSSLIGRRSGNRGMCAQPCRLQYSLGGRMDDYPLSMKDNCLVNFLSDIEKAGVSCIKIEGRMKRPEYSAIVTGIYSRALKEKKAPTADELHLLSVAFSRSGFTHGYLSGDKNDMFGTRGEQEKDAEHIFAEARKQYASGEARRVPVHFYTLVQKNENIKAIAFDDEGNKATAIGPVPENARNQGLTEPFLVEQMYKTGGTPYYCVENKAKTDPGLFLPSSEINKLRRELLNDLSEKRCRKPDIKVLDNALQTPVPKSITRDPVNIFHVRTCSQLSPQLAELKPEYIYVPAMELAENFSIIKPFIGNNTIPVAVLPRVITDDQTSEVKDTLIKLFDLGINEALVGNLGHIFLAKSAGMKIRGDFGLNVFNSYSLDFLRSIGLLSATASFELRISQIKELIKSVNTELIVYGRLPLMISEQCILRASSDRCTCATPGQLTDRMGEVFPVVREYGCRNVIYNAHKLFMADKKDDIYASGVWGTRMLFTTESARECVETAKGYLGFSDYRPNILTRGLYYRGVD